MAPRQVVAEEFFGGSRRSAVWERVAQDRAQGATPGPGGNADPGAEAESLLGRGKPSIVRTPCTRELAPFVHSLSTAFLPVGYPESVTPDYLHFQVWDSLQGLSTYIRSMLSTQVLLGGLGVGQVSASALGATFQWFLRDFTGMLGGIIFTFLKGSNLDSNAKQWRLAADVINDVGMLLDLVSPLYPPAFLPMLCLGSISRAITGTASGATRAALTQHFALKQNAADIAAKCRRVVRRQWPPCWGCCWAWAWCARWPTTLPHSGPSSSPSLPSTFTTLGQPARTQETCLAQEPTRQHRKKYTWGANYKAVASLCLTSLNRKRTAILLQEYLRCGTVLSAAQMAAREPILPPLLLPPSWREGTPPKGVPGPGLGRPSAPPSLMGPLHSSAVALGCPLSALDSHSGSWDSLDGIIRRYGKGSYLLWRSAAGSVDVILHQNCGPGETLRAFVHALLLTSGAGSSQAAGESDAVRWMAGEYPGFKEKLKSAGWAVDHVVLAPKEWRARWETRVEE